MIRAPNTRVEALAGPVQRIGLSATQKPLSDVARFLCGTGRDCTEGEGHQEIVLFDLNKFGMPKDMDLALDGITPRWVQKGGKYLYVYEAQLTQYGPAAGVWFVSLHPTAPVTGAVLRRHARERQMQQWLFTPAEGCR